MVSETNIANMFALIKENKNTGFGKKHHFREIATLEDYRKNVPLSSYKDYEEDFDKMRQGQEHVLTNYPIVGYCQSSGSSGKTKTFAYTREQVKRYGDHEVRFENMIFERFGGKKLLVNCFRIQGEPDLQKNYLLSELYAYGMENYLQRSFSQYLGGNACTFSENSDNNLYVKSWLAFAEPEITIIRGIYLYDVLMLFHYMRKHWRRIIEDMRTGKISVPLSQEIAKTLLQNNCDKKRLDYVEEQCKIGFHKIAKRLWKNIRLIMGISAPNYFSENISLEFYCEGIMKHYSSYIASECFIAEGIFENQYRYRLVPEAAFFEFMPCDDDHEPKLPEQLQMGKKYKVILSNFGGLYRYQMDDIIKFVGYDKDCPVFEFVGKELGCMNVAGEKMELSQLEQVVNKLQHKGIFIEEYCFSFLLDEMPVRYLFVATASQNEFDEEELALLVDQCMREENIDYDDLRGMGYINLPKCILLSPESFQEFRSQYGLQQGHNKPKHLLPAGIVL